MEENNRIYEYVSASNPLMPEIPVLIHSCKLHQEGETRLIPFDLSNELKSNYPMTSPNLLVSFIRIKKNESISFGSKASSNAFYIIEGSGICSVEKENDINWNKGDLFVLPHFNNFYFKSLEKDCSIYWYNDEPLMNYLKVIPYEPSFKPSFFKNEIMLKEVEKIKNSNNSKEKNRTGILLGNKMTDYMNLGGSGTLTLTPTLWSLLNVLPSKTIQKPHRHNSIALDLCVFSSDSKKVYTEMGPELNEDGKVKNPIKCYWETGSVFITPPGWWHSHHNETNDDAWVLPAQDAGLYTYQRTLDIKFST